MFLSLGKIAYNSAYDEVPQDNAAIHQRQKHNEERTTLFDVCVKLHCYTFSGQFIARRASSLPLMGSKTI